MTPPILKESQRWRGLRIGLFGGSFNPVHEGHLHVARLARVKFDLDFVWWLVTPQNPLKESKITKPYEQRFNKVDDYLKSFPRQMPTHLEKELNTDYSYQTISGLKNAFPHTNFIWICGMDNAHIFHKWDHWQSIVETMPIAFIARPPASDLVKSCPLRMTSNLSHRYATLGRQTDLKEPAIYWLTGGKMLDISSTDIRNNQAKSKR